MTLDNKNNLWVCHFNGACISVFNKSGNRIHKIDLQAKNITNCAFGGQNNKELFITSATKSMSKADMQKYPYSGALFSIKTNSKGFVPKKFIRTSISQGDFNVLSNSELTKLCFWEFLSDFFTCPKISGSPTIIESIPVITRKRCLNASWPAKRN